MANEDLNRIHSHKWLVIFLITTGISMLISNQFGAHANELSIAIISIVSLGALVVFSVKIITNAKSKHDRILGLVFGTFSMLWFTGEQVGNIYYNLILNVDLYPSAADAFYIAALGILAAFVFLLAHTFREFMTKKILATSGAVAASFLIPSIILIASTEDNSINIVVSLLYPILDSIILVPLLSMVVMFSGIRRIYLWPLLVAMIVEIVTDTLFLFVEIDNSNYTGHPIWIGYELANILFAYAAYRQSVVMKNVKIPVGLQLKSDMRKNMDRKDTITAPLLISSSAIIFIFSLIRIYSFSDLSTVELSFFEPIIYGGVIVIIFTTVLIAWIFRKLSSMKVKIEESTREFERADITREKPTAMNLMSSPQKKIHILEKIEKYSIKSILIISILVVVGVSYFTYITYIEQNTSEHIQTKFIVENLKGDIVKTWVSWRLIDGERLHIVVLNSDLVSSDKIDAIKNAILSEETIEIPNSELGKQPEDASGTYYLGWGGALKKAAEKKSEINIPTDLHISISDKPVGHIIIVLSNLKESDGTLGFTKSIADDQQSQILKSTITIFDVANLDTHELTGIVRHEFGHAIGLGHSTAVEDLMFPKFNSKYAYISDCDIDSIASLYDKRGSPTVVCEN